MHQGAVGGMPERRVAVAQLDGDHPRLLVRPDPGQVAVAGGVVGGQQGSDPVRDPHPLVGLVRDVERPDPRGDRMLARRRDEDLLVVLDGRRGDVALALQAIAAADHFLVPPGPLLIVQQGVMQHHDPLAALHEVAEVLLAGVVEVAGEIVHDHDVVLAPQVLA